MNKSTSKLSFTKKFKLLNIIGFFVTFALAFLFHYLFELTGKNILIAFLAPVNESVWEHVKILVHPFLLFALAQYFILKPNFKKFFTSVALVSALIPIIMIILYTLYTGILGKDNFVINIILTAVVLAISFWLLYLLYNNCTILNNLFTISIFLLILLIVMIISFTVNPPKIGLFLDSRSNQYGILTFLNLTV